jgi:glutamate-1-semialdehyde 2,1-aminomutase
MVLAGLGALVLPGLVLKAKRRLELSRGKHPSLGGHAKMSRRVAKLLPFYEYDEAGFFNSDDAPAEVVALRRAGFFRLAGIYQQRFAASAALTAVGPAVHRRLPGALPVQPLPAPAPEGRRLPEASSAASP